MTTRSRRAFRRAELKQPTRDGTDRGRERRKHAKNQACKRHTPLLSFPVSRVKPNATEREGVVAVAKKVVNNLDDDLLADGTMSVSEAAEFTGYSVDSIELMVKSGELPWTQLRLRGRRLIPKRALTRLLAKNMVNGN